MTTEELRGWALALRDLTEQGASQASVAFTPGVILAYKPGEGATMHTPDGGVHLPDELLDQHGLVLT